MRVTISHTNPNPDTIWNRLAARLGREPSDTEASDEVRRILSEGTAERAAAGKLTHQGKGAAR